MNMKKLLFILPVLAWIGTYFVWTYSAQFFDGTP